MKRTTLELEIDDRVGETVVNDHRITVADEYIVVYPLVQIVDERLYIFGESAWNLLITRNE